MSSCGEKRPNNNPDKFVVETTVRVTEGKTQEVLELFKSTNPVLVSEEPDWIQASFSFIEDINIVIVRAEWKSKESYIKFSDSDKYKETMGQFGKYFIGKPNVMISKVLFEM